MGSPFSILETAHGKLIVNQNDWAGEGDSKFGVSHQLLTKGEFETIEVSGLKGLIDQQHSKNGDGVVVLDCGANLGVHSIDWATHMSGWGEVISVEAQKMIFCSLAGAVALNNLDNITPIHAVLGEECGEFEMATPNYNLPGSFGSFELTPVTMDVGQQIDYTKTTPVRMISIDSMNLPRLDLIKIDVEGAEASVLRGAKDTLMRLHPIIHIEVNKSDRKELAQLLMSYGYTNFRDGFILGNWVVEA
jgi:FkbM family methyltransferase